MVTKKSESSPMMFLSVNDVIVELQDKKITNSNQFSNLVKNLVDKGQKTFMFGIYGSDGQRTYLTLKLK